MVKEGIDLFDLEGVQYPLAVDYDCRLVKVRRLRQPTS